MNGEMIILTGPPGAGKTTVAELLATTASVPTVHLVTDVFASNRLITTPKRRQASRVGERCPITTLWRR